MGDEGDNFDWDSEDDREIENFGLSSSCCSLPTVKMTACSVEASSVAGSSGTKVVDRFLGMGFSEKMVADAIQENGEENPDLILEALLKYSPSSPASSSGSKLIDHFVGMGFDVKMVARAISENGEEKTDSILETLLTYSEIEKFPQEQPHVDSDNLSSEYDESFLNDFSDLDSSENEENEKSEPDEGETLRFLASMGYTRDEASIAVERCGMHFGPDATISELADFICAAQMAKAADASFIEEKPKVNFDDDYPKNKRRKSNFEIDMLKRKKQINVLPVDGEIIQLPIKMIGFGTPTDPSILTHRDLPKGALGPPFFYYENVALAPKGAWQTISRFLYDIKPEFVDSKYFCAAARKRGYIHNLPIKNRFPLLPLPPHTIHEALPLTKRWWPSWDERTQLNCLQTCMASAKLTERILKAIEGYDGEPPERIQKYVLEQCRKWNLVWVGRNKVAPLEPDEVEMLLGFPRNHTRGGGISRTDRYKSLGNSFQVDTVAYHLSVLKDLFPEGITLLSLFTGIGGGEVALHRLGIKLKNVVSVEISEVNRNILRCWWEQTNQTGLLIEIPDVQQLDADMLEKHISAFGGFDLIIGGSPCNNLAGSNRHHRDGLEGEQSSLFFDYCRILDLVKNIMARNSQSLS
ncbi:DNA (cytosine-5)-methyltransferase DRM1 isoform X2 [Mercurialis annua]|uniref:DNA (cytosine-5)-methyltransferase DRM1 isoform X2 n=1 Tax=Mercurialis annua TaxID=3986 RepID=UPI00215E8CD3|nr:DNA (cytosine-5)-methyltransferase DRM1 isoform X2 [Mercurialis annua]